MHAWYSTKQSNKRITHCLYASNNENKPYIYYKDMNDKIVEVTCVSSTNEHNCKFDDLQYLGVMKEFYCNSKEPLSLEILNKNNK